MLSINTNISSLRAQTSLLSSSNMYAVSQQRLSSGSRINSAKDDAAGLAIATSMDSQIRGMDIAKRNANDAISLVQTAESALGTGTKILQKMRELAVQASSDNLTTENREKVNAEYDQLSKELNSLYSKTEFNGKKILGADAGTLSFQIGANSGETLSVSTPDAKTLFAAHGDVTTSANATTALDAIDKALGDTATQRATLGASLSRLDYVVENLTNSITNTTEAMGRIMDTDYAAETAKSTKAQILQQASVAMLSQANSSPQIILSLLGG